MKVKKIKKIIRKNSNLNRPKKMNQNHNFNNF